MFKRIGEQMSNIFGVFGKGEGIMSAFMTGFDYLGRIVAVFVTDFLYAIESQYTYRPDLLAYDLYGTPQLWWVFVQRNLDVLQDPIFDFVPGKQIYIPKNSSLKTVAQIKFEDVYPVSLNTLRFESSGTDTDYFVAEVTFKYKSYDLCNKEGVSVI